MSHWARRPEAEAVGLKGPSPLGWADGGRECAGGEIEEGTPGVLYVRTTSYYYFGGQRVAMRQVDTWGRDVVYYLLSDHLGTTSVVLDADGDKVAESRHYPYGAERWSWSADGSGALPTDYRFTGQRDVGYIKLYQMGARFYDPSLGRWTSADTIVPDFTNPQSLNRYSYVYNRPLRYSDPSGHDLCGDDYEEGCGPDYGCGPDHPERCGNPWYMPPDMFLEWLKWQMSIGANWWEALTKYYPFTSETPPMATWTSDDGEGVIPFLPNPHLQLREDWQALNDAYLFGSDVAADGMTIFGHAIAILSGASAIPPPVGDELLEAFGAMFFLKGATLLDGAALVDTGITEGGNSKEFFVQLVFFGADWLTGRTLGTYGLQLVVSAADVGVDVLGDSAAISKTYGPGLTFYQWCERNSCGR